MTPTTKHFSPRASLAALGLRLRRLRLLEAIAAHVNTPHKTVRHAPAEKLYDAFLAILSGAHGLSEINTRLRSGPALQRSFGRRTCAEYSLVQDTLDACTAENVEELRRVVTSLFRAHSRAFPHAYPLVDFNIRLCELYANVKGAAARVTLLPNRNPLRPHPPASASMSISHNGGYQARRVAPCRAARRLRDVCPMSMPAWSSEPPTPVPPCVSM
jgi:hypothetical protein